MIPSARSPHGCQVNEPLCPNFAHAGVFDNTLHSSTELLEYYPRLNPDDSDNDEVDVAIAIQRSRTQAPFPLYNVLICLPLLMSPRTTLYQRNSDPA